MRRLWLGIGLLLALLALGIGLLFFSNCFFQAFSSNWEAAAEFALAGDWASATKKAEESRAMWQQSYRFFSASTDHEPIEEVQELFSLLEIYARDRRNVEFSTVCQSLTNLGDAINESHNLRWWSIL